MRSLGLDIGSTSVKGAVLDLELGRLGPSVSRPFPAPIASLPPGWFEVDPRQIVAVADEVVDELATLAPDATGLFVSGQMGGTILVDRSGKPVTHYLSWRDQRSLVPADGGSLLQQVGDRLREALNELGRELQAGSTTVLLAWLASQRAIPDGATFASSADFVISQWTNVPPAMHVTHAIGLLDLASGDWHRDAFERLGLPATIFPNLLTDERPQGELRRGRLSIPIYGAYGDQQCALRGAGLQQGELSINVSTGSQVSCRRSAGRGGEFQTRRYFFGDWLETITHLPAGRSLNVLVDLLTELATAEGIVLRDPWGTLARKADEVDAAKDARDPLEVDLSFFAGPMGSRGRIGNATTENLTAGRLFHAAIETMADNYARCAARLDPQSNWTTVVLSGGLASHVPLLRRKIGRCFSASIRESPAEETLLGLLDLARSNAGV